MFAETMQRRARLQRHDLCSCHDGYSFWQTGLGASHGTGTSPTATGYDASLGGYALGIERLITTNDGALRYGLAAAYTGGSVRSGASSAQLDSEQLGTYASIQKNAWLFSGALGYGFLDYDIDRGIPIAGSAPLVASGNNVDGGVIAMSFATSYNLARHFGPSAAGMRIAPIIRYDYINARRNGYRESGATLLDLTANRARFEGGLISYGLELGRQIRTANGVRLNFLYDIRYEHLLGDQNVVSVSTLTNVGGAPFFSPGALEQRDRLALGLGVGAELSKSVTTHLRYDTSLGKDFSAHRASTGVTVRF